MSPFESQQEPLGGAGADRVGALGSEDTAESPSGGELAVTTWTDGNLPRENRLLAALPPEVYERLRPHLTLVELGLREILWEKDGPIPYVYFPLNGVVSMIAIMHDGSSVEVGTVGNEGMAGLPVFLGAARANIRAFSQVPGQALRMSSDDLRAEVAENVPLRELLQLYAQALFGMIAQASACHRVHSASQRLALWIAMCRDRVGLDTFPLTQEFLAQMVGVQRTTVSDEASRLQRNGTIRYSRGVLTVVDRGALEAAACECLHVIREEYEQLLGPYSHE